MSTLFGWVCILLIGAAFAGAGTIAWLIACGPGGPGGPRAEIDDRQSVPVRRARYAAHPLAQALLTIPDALIYPPERNSGGDGYGVIVLSADPALIEASRAAIRSVRGRHIYFIAGIAPTHPLASPGSRWRGLWSYSYCNGELAGSEPVGIQHVSIVFRRPRCYWMVVPVDGWSAEAGAPGEMFGAAQQVVAAKSLPPEHPHSPASLPV